MRLMATPAQPLGHGRMRILRPDRRSDLLVTRQAEFRQFLPDQARLIGKMRVVAGRASVLLHRAMDRSAIDESMAGATENSGGMAGGIRHLDPQQAVGE